MNVAVPFPEERPPGYEWLLDEVPFNPAEHLALEPPSEVIDLTELGYDEVEIEPTATPVAVSSPFRVLSKAGAEIMLETARRLRPQATRAGNRIENVVRGGCYRSRWAQGSVRQHGGHGGDVGHLWRASRAAFHAGASGTHEFRACRSGRSGRQVAP